MDCKQWTVTDSGSDDITPYIRLSEHCYKNYKAPFIRYNLLSNIQPVVKPAWQQATGLAVSCIQPVVKPVVKLVVKPVVQPGLTYNRFDNWLNEQWLFVQHGCQMAVRSTRLSNRLYNRVVKPVVYNRFDNRLYRVNKHPTGCQCGLTTGCIM